MPYTSLDLTNNQVIKNELYLQLQTANQIFDSICRVDDKNIDDMTQTEIEHNIEILLNIKRSIEHFSPPKPTFTHELICSVDEDHSTRLLITPKAILLDIYRKDVIHSAKSLASIIDSLRAKIQMIEYIISPYNHCNTMQLYAMTFMINDQKSHEINSKKYSYNRLAEIERDLPFNADLVGTPEDIMLNSLLQERVVKNEIRDRNNRTRESLQAYPELPNFLLRPVPSANASSANVSSANASSANVSSANVSSANKMHP